MREERQTRGQNGETERQPAFAPYREAWALQFERTFRAIACAGDCAAASARIIGLLSGARCFPEVPEVVEALRARYRLAVLSNADDDFLHSFLTGNDLHFEAVISSESVRAAKPHPEIFRHACAVLDLPPERVLYVGDSPRVDLVGARAAGMPVAWVNRAGVALPDGIPAPDIELRDLRGLLAPLGLHFLAAGADAS